jgi:hypothetical protein
MKFYFRHQTVLVFFTAMIFPCLALADNYEVNISNGNVSTNESGTISSDAQIEGITIINDVLYIDGVKIPKDQREYYSKKTKKTYVIKRSQGGNISVTEK